MYSKARIAGHPIHPMLIAFPVAFYTATLVAFAAYAINDNPFWFRVGYVSNIAAIVTAVLAAIPGFIDWAAGIPKDTPAKSTGLKHMLLNLATLALFIINAVVWRDKWDDVLPAADNAWILPLIGVLCTLVAGWLGWRLVQTHHVGILLTRDQERIDELSAGNAPARRHSGQLPPLAT